MFTKPDKPSDLRTTNKHIGLSPYFSTIFEGLVIKLISPHIISNNILPILNLALEPNKTQYIRYIEYSMQSLPH